jgi:hypothetical protein
MREAQSVGQAVTMSSDHVAGCACPSCRRTRDERRRDSALGAITVLVVAGGLTLLIAWLELGRTAGELGWIVAAYAAFGMAALRWPANAERGYPHSSSSVGRAGRRAAIGVAIPGYVAGGVVLLLAGLGIGPGRQIGALLRWLSSVSDGLTALLSLLGTVFWLGVLGLVLVIGALVSAARAMIGRRRPGHHGMNWRHALGGAALLALVALELWLLREDPGWLRDMLTPPLDTGRQ